MDYQEACYNYCMYVKVKVTPSANTEFLREFSNDSFEVDVREKPINNMANRRVIELIARHFGLAPSQVRIVSGHHSRGKILDIAINK